MIDFKEFLQADESEDFTKSFKDDITRRAFTKLEDIKRTMAKDYLKSDENESS
jgi:hypothetical protein